MCIDRCTQLAGVVKKRHYQKIFVFIQFLFDLIPLLFSCDQPSTITNSTLTDSQITFIKYFFYGFLTFKNCRANFILKSAITHQMTIQMEKRKFNVSNSELFEFTGTVLYHLDEDLEKFKLFDPDLNETKKGVIATLYHQSVSSPTDQEEKARITQKTMEFHQLKDRSRVLVSQVRYFVEKKFNDRKGIQDEFGFKTYQTSTRSQVKFIEFMLRMAKTTLKYGDQLMQSGVSETVLNEIQTLAQELTRVNTEQEAYKNTRKLSTVDRTQLYNQIYDELGHFSDAAAIVFSNDPVRRKRYVLPNNSGQPSPKHADKDDASLN